MVSFRPMARNLTYLMKNNKLIDNVQSNTFSINIYADFGKICYQREGDIYNLTHTSIPDQYQGKGLGSILAERVFDHLLEEGKKIRLTCDFLQDFYLRNKSKYYQIVIEK